MFPDGHSGILLGGLLTIAEASGAPLELLEIGASAGLNLIPDHYRYRLGAHRWGDPRATPEIECKWRGPPPPLAANLMIEDRAGVDLRPVDPAERPSPLLAYLWPDQPSRRARMTAALDRLAATGLKVEAGAAPAWLDRRLAAAQPPGRVRVVMHSIMWMYMAPAARAATERSIETAGALADAARPLAHLSLEPDGAPGSAAIRLRLWPGGGARVLGRGDYHSRWAEWA